jgi:DNA polymerase-1
VHYGGAKSYAEAKEKILSDIKAKNLTFVYEQMEVPIVPVVEAMEQYGITIDRAKMQLLADTGHKNLSAIERRIWDHAGREFNVNSPKQLGEILFDEMKVQEGSGARMKKTDAGARSTRESELVKLQGIHPIIDEILAYRELSKLVFTYIDALPTLIAPDGRVHATFNQAGTTTGRFSSTNPNLQNIPVKNALAKEIREAFVVQEGHTFLSFDYSQIELRVAALLSRDEFLIQTFRDGRDIHSAVASRVFGVPENEVTSEMRRKAKVINFGILYGMGVSALRENLGGERKEAQAFYDNYFASFPKIAGYMEDMTAFAKANGYSATLFGRRRPLTGLRSPLPYLRAMAERQAGNAPVQGTAADLMKLAIRDAHEALKHVGLLEKAHLVLQVHDEIIYEVEDAVIEQVSQIVQKAMLEVIRPEYLGDYTTVPLEVHVGQGHNWGELK